MEADIETRNAHTEEEISMTVGRKVYAARRTPGGRQNTHRGDPVMAHRYDTHPSLFACLTADFKGGGGPPLGPFLALDRRFQRSTPVRIPSIGLTQLVQNVMILASGPPPGLGVGKTVVRTFCFAGTPVFIDIRLRRHTCCRPPFAKHTPRGQIGYAALSSPLTPFI